MKTFKQIMKESGNIILSRDIDNAKVVIEPDGSYTFWKNNGKTKGAQNRSLHGQEGAVKELMAIGYKPAKSLNESAPKKLTESKKRDDRDIDFENIAGGIEINPGYDGYYISNYSGGSGYNKEWKSDEYKKLRSNNDNGSINKLRENIIKDLVPVCDRFDRELESVMKKYGFKK